MRYGSFSVEISNHPRFGASAAMNAPQSEISPSISRTSAPHALDSRTMAIGVSVGHGDHAAQARRRRIRRGSPAGIAGRRQRNRGHAQTLRGRDRGRDATRLERIGGVLPFLLDEQPIEAQLGAEAARVDQRRHPLTEGDGLRTGQHLRKPPHRVHAPPQCLAAQRLRRRGQVVPRQQRRVAGQAQVLWDRVVQHHAAAGPGTLEVCEGRRGRRQAARV